VYRFIMCMMGRITACTLTLKRWRVDCCFFLGPFCCVLINTNSSVSFVLFYILRNVLFLLMYLQLLNTEALLTQKSFLFW